MQPPAPNYSFLNVSDAQKVRDAGLDVAEIVVKLAGLGLRPPAIVDYATAVADGRPPPVALEPGRTKDLVIQAHSFLQDVRQYGQLYAVSEERIQELRGLFASDREACFAEIVAIVSAVLRGRGSNRGVSVIDAGAPGSAPTGASSTVGSASLMKAYSQEIARDSGTYGSYSFTAFETHRGLAQGFGVDLGSDVFVLAQSKRLAIAIARITRVRGRFDPLVRDHVYYVASNGRAVSGSDIPDTVPTLIQGPRDKVNRSRRFPSSGADPGQAPSTAYGRAEQSTVGTPRESPSK